MPPARHLLTGVTYESHDGLRFGAGLWDGHRWHHFGTFSTATDAKQACDAGLNMATNFAIDKQQQQQQGGRSAAAAFGPGPGRGPGTGPRDGPRLGLSSGSGQLKPATAAGPISPNKLPQPFHAKAKASKGLSLDSAAAGGPTAAGARPPGDMLLTQSGSTEPLGPRSELQAGMAAQGMACAPAHQQERRPARQHASMAAR
jgi:hypothetical protein